MNGLKRGVDTRVAIKFCSQRWAVDLQQYFKRIFNKLNVLPLGIIALMSHTYDENFYSFFNYKHLAQEVG